MITTPTRSRQSPLGQAYPLYALMGTGFNGGLLALFIAGILIGAVGGPLPAFLSERFPTRHRGMGIAVVYAITVAIFGGTVEYIALFAKQRGVESWFYAYVTVCAAISLVVYARMPDTRDTSRIDRE